MTYPYGGEEMRHGEITATDTIIRWIEGEKAGSKMRKLTTLRIKGRLPAVPHFGFAHGYPQTFA